MSMYTDEIVVGLDIGTTKVVAVAAKFNEHGTIDILGLGKAESDGVKRGEINNIDKTVNAIRMAIEHVETQSGLEVGNVFVSVSGEHVRSRQEKGIITLNDPDSEISADDLQRLKQEMFKVHVPMGWEIVHVLPQEYTVDNQDGIKDPVGMSGVRLEGHFHIVMAQTNSLRNLQRCIRRAGLDIADLVFQPYASAHAVLSDEEREAGVCLVDIGGGTTDLIIYQDELVRHTAVIPFGGNIVTEDIKHGCSLMARQADLLKSKYGSAMASSLQDTDEIITIAGLSNRPPKEIHTYTLANIIQARMEEILEFVTQEIEKSGYQHKLVGGIVLTGGGAQLRHLCDLSEFVTGIDTRLGLPGSRFAKGMVSELADAQYAAAAGLAAYGLQCAMDEINQAVATSPAKPAAERRKPQPQPAGHTEPRRQSRTAPPATEDPGSPNIVNKMKRWFESAVTGSNPNID
jgi:cell division protein FtsA